MKTLFRLAFVTTLICSLAVFSLEPTQSDEKPNASGKTNDVKIQDITLRVPQTWKQQPPANRLRLAQFDIPAAEGDKEDAELVISSFGGGGGGIDANVQRWVEQFQPEGRKAKIHTGTSPQGAYVIADLTGTYNKPDGPRVLRKTIPTPGSRMLAVILTVEDKANYFLKLTGPEKTVTAAADAMRASFGADAEKEKEYKPQGDADE
jgi:hypothetical protein